METNKSIVRKNRVKWKTLPAGAGRKQVDTLLSLGDNELLDFYNDSIRYWEKERGWEYDKYASQFSARSILEIGSGLGYDGITYSKSAECWTFCDIIPENIQLVRRIARLMDVSNVKYQTIEDFIHHDYGDQYNGFYAHGVLHHVPFEIAKKEVSNIDRYLTRGAKVVLLMYPYERWVLCGKPSFEEFGTMTDGEGTPWAEYYDDQKIKALFGDSYKLESSINWGHQNAEFVNFELIKLGKSDG